MTVGNKIKKFFNLVIHNLQEYTTHIDKNNIIKFTTKSLSEFIPVFGGFIQHAIDEFYPESKDTLKEQLKKLSEDDILELSEQFKISDKVISTVKAITFSYLDDLKSDHQQMLVLLKEIAKHVKDDRTLTKTELIHELERVYNSFIRFRMEKIFPFTKLIPIHKISRRLLKEKAIDNRDQMKIIRLENSFHFTEILDKFGDDGSNNFSAVITGIPGIGKTSCSLQIAIQQLKRILNNKSILIPIWFDFGNRDYNFLDKLSECLNKESLSEQLKLYLKLVGIENVSISIPNNCKPLWIFDSWNETPIEQRTRIVGHLANLDNLLLFTRQQSEPSFVSDYKWSKIERYCLQPFDKDNAIHFLQENFKFSLEVSKTIVFEIKKRLSSDFQIPLFLNTISILILNCLEVDDLRNEHLPVIIDYFKRTDISPYFLLYELMISLICRECNLRREDLRCDLLLEWISNVFLDLVLFYKDKPITFHGKEVQNIIIKKNTSLEYSFVRKVEIFTNTVFLQSLKTDSTNDIAYSLIHELFSDFLLAYRIYYDWKNNNGVTQENGKRYLKWMSNQSFDMVWALVEDAFKFNGVDISTYIKSIFKHRTNPHDHQMNLLDALLHNEKKISRLLSKYIRLSPQGILSLDLSENIYEINLSMLDDCQSLEYIDLSRNKLKKLTLPFSSLSNLRILDVSWNQLTGLPSEIGKLKQLEILNLWNNNISELPNSIGELKKLRSMSLWGNELFSLPQRFSELSNLKNLNLSANRFLEFPEVVLHLSNLEQLDLSFNDLNTLSDNIDALVKLVFINLENTKIKAIPTSLRKMANLKILHSLKSISKEPFLGGIIPDEDFSKRLLLEEQEIQTSGFSFKALTTDRTHWQGYIEGAGIYENGYFVIDIQISRSYPFKAPVVICLTKIFHPNFFNKSICLDILGSGWHPKFRLLDVIKVITFLIENPNANDSLSSVAANLMRRDFQSFKNKVREYVNKYATKDQLEQYGLI